MFSSMFRNRKDINTALVAAADGFVIDAQHLIQLSPHRRRIQELLADPKRGTIPPEGSTLCSNCHGTLRYVLGLEDHLSCYYPEQMGKFLEANCLPRDGGEIVAFYYKLGKRRGGLTHTALRLGMVRKQQVLFHQPNTGEEYSLDTLGNYLGFTLVEPYFFSLR